MRRRLTREALDQSLRKLCLNQHSNHGSRATTYSSIDDVDDGDRGLSAVCALFVRQEGFEGANASPLLVGQVGAQVKSPGPPFSIISAAALLWPV